MLRTRSPRKEKISNCYLHSNSLSNKMDNSLLAVRDINHKYIVVGKKKKAGKGAKPEATDNTKNKEDFEAMKRKTKGILIGMIAAVVAAVAGLVIYKATR